MTAVPNRAGDQDFDEGRWSVAFDPWVLFAFLIPFSGIAYVDLGGRVYLQDLVGVALLGFLFPQRDSLKRLSLLRVFFGLLLLWLIGQVITDIWVGTSGEDLRRGWFKIVLFGTQTAALWLLLPRRLAYLVAYGVGYGIAIAISAVYFSEYSKEALRFGLGLGLAVAPMALITPWFSRSKQARYLAVAILAVLGILTLLQNARSLFGALSLTAGITVVAATLIARPSLIRKITPYSFAGFLLGAVLIGQALVSVYSYAAGSGYLGDDARRKYLDQGSGDVSIIQGGRVESLVSLDAIADSPIIGHGSWAKDPYYTRLLIYRMKLLGITYQGNTRKIDPQIPSHSFLLGSWVEAGILGAVFWAYMGWLTIVSFYRMLRQPHLAAPLVTLMLFTLMWDIPFSPFGSSARFEVAFQVVLIGWILHGFAARAIPAPASRKPVAMPDPEPVPA